MGWQKASGYNRRALAEATIGRFKRVIGDGLRSRTDQRQATEMNVAVAVLNRMVELGRPKSVRIAWTQARVGSLCPPADPCSGSQITAAYSRYGVAHWLSRSRLADRCAMPSFRSPHALAAPARLRGRRRSPINAPLDQQGPDDAGRLVGQGHGDQHLRLARQHPRQPRARWCAALTGPADHRTRAEDEQTPDGPLAHLRDCAEPLLAAGRFLQGRQPEPGGEVAPGPEALRRGHEGRDRGGRDRTDAWDRHQ